MNKKSPWLLTIGLAIYVALFVIRDIIQINVPGVIEVDDQWRVLGMEEKPEVPKSNWAVPPFYIYLKKDLDLVRESVANGCGKDAPGNLAHYMVKKTAMHAWQMTASRFDIGSLDTYHEACKSSVSKDRRYIV